MNRSDLISPDREMPIAEDASVWIGKLSYDIQSANLMRMSNTH